MLFSDDPATDAATWQPYVPDAECPWNLRRVVHLHRRAGFAATANEIQRDLADGPQKAVERVLMGETRAEGVPADFDHVAELLGETATAANDPARLKVWWLYRMLFSPDPLGERLTLLWHNHFATSNLKVNDLAAMRRQNELFRRFARAPFGELLAAVTHDPALLVWLDAQANRKEHPNENLGRELLELFTLGVGHYGEEDVKEAARSLTGWTVKRGEFAEAPQNHDDGEKTVLGRTGRWRGDDLVKILLDQPATSVRIAGRICELFFGDGVIDTDAVASLATGMSQRQFDIGWAVETVLRSRRFFDDGNLGNRVLGPAEFVVGAARLLEHFNPPPSTLLLAEWMATLGQDLFYPINVFGWPGGRAWITTRSVIGRANYAAALVDGSLTGNRQPLDVAALVERHGRGRDLDDAIELVAELALGYVPTGKFHDRLRAALGGQAGTDAGTLRRAAAWIIASPEGQLA